LSLLLRCRELRHRHLLWQPIRLRSFRAAIVTTDITGVTIAATGIGAPNGAGGSIAIGNTITATTARIATGTCAYILERKGRGSRPESPSRADPRPVAVVLKTAGLPSRSKGRRRPHQPDHDQTIPTLSIAGSANVPCPHLSFHHLARRMFSCLSVGAIR
jgi:hypothetical protein